MPENSLAPIYSKSDNELVTEAKGGSSDSISVLMERHTPLFVKIIGKHKDYLQSSGVCPEDLFDEKPYLFFEAIKTFKPEKNVKFNTWFGNRVRYHCLNRGNYIKTHGSFVGYEEPKELDCVVNHYLTSNKNSYRNLDKSLIFSALQELDDKRIADVFEQRYFGNKVKSWHEIGRILGFSCETARVLHRRGLSHLKKHKDIIEKHLDFLD